MIERDVAVRIARRFDSYFLRGYAVGKLLIDPMYRAVLDRVARVHGPIVDVGCGIGLAAQYLREHGVTASIIGLDFDRRKVEAARRAAAEWREVDLREGDARAPLPPSEVVLLLDVLHYFTRDDQQTILRNAAAAASVVIIRDALRDDSWRYRVTAIAEGFARAVSWLKAERLNFLALSEIEGSFEGFERDIVPMHGGTPFNNYLLVFRRSSAGTTNA